MVHLLRDSFIQIWIMNIERTISHIPVPMWFIIFVNTLDITHCTDLSLFIIINISYFNCYSLIQNLFVITWRIRVWTIFTGYGFCCNLPIYFHKFWREISISAYLIVPCYAYYTRLKTFVLKSKSDNDDNFNFKLFEKKLKFRTCVEIVNMEHLWNLEVHTSPWCLNELSIFLQTL